MKKVYLIHRREEFRGAENNVNKIKNLKNVEDDLTIFDRIPHSSSENIKVELNEIDPEPNKKELGVLKWKLNLKGLDEKVIHYRYSIEYKKGISINHPLP